MSSLHPALPRLLRLDIRKGRVAATPPRPARISQMDEGRTAVDRDHHKVPNTYEGMFSTDYAVNVKIIEQNNP